ncbi:PKD domain-containing protein [Halosimplex aquaticum]
MEPIGRTATRRGVLHATGVGAAGLALGGLTGTAAAADGETAEGWWASHSYGSAGAYTVALTATDNTDHSTTHEVEITVE